MEQDDTALQIVKGDVSDALFLYRKL